MMKNTKVQVSFLFFLTSTLLSFAYFSRFKNLNSPVQAASSTPKVYEKNGKVWLENSKFKAGFNLSWGASLTDLVVGGVEIVNRHDPGREVQLALYDGNDTYDNCAGCTGTFGWDPVQGGDKYGHGSKVISKKLTTKDFYAKIRPVQWSPDDKGGGSAKAIETDVYIEQWASFVPDYPEALKLHYKITHFGTDSHAVARQELPAIYVNKDFNTFFYYGGNMPWTNGSLSSSTLPNLSNNLQYPHFYSPESWGSLVKTGSKSGLTVFTPGQQYYETGFHFDGNGSTGPTGEATNYFSPFVYYAFGPNNTLEGDLYLISGDYIRARQIVYGIKKSLTMPHLSYPISTLDSPQKNQQISSSSFNISGWAFDALSPITTVQVYIDNALNGNATYPVSRPDVATVFPSIPANVGFTYPLDTSKLAAGNHTITIKIATADGKIVTAFNTPVSIQNDGLPIGYFDSASCTEFVGWTCDPNDYTTSLDVHFYKDAPYQDSGTFIGMTKANIVRESGVSSLCGNVAAHGFTFQTPANLFDNISHSIYAYAINTPTGSNPVLSQSPKAIHCDSQGNSSEEQI